MKKSFLLLFVSTLILSACVTTKVYPGEKEGRQYINQSARACQTIRFFCVEGFQPFSDETGCGCEPLPADAPDNGSDLDPATFAQEGEACGFIGGRAVRCAESSFCATVSWLPDEPVFRCVGLNICNESTCGEEERCIVLESWPAKVTCAAVDQDPEELLEEVLEEVMEEAEEAAEEEEVAQEEEVSGEQDEEPVTDEEEEN